MEQVKIPEWIPDSHGASLKLLPYPLELFASSFAKLNLCDANIPEPPPLGNLLQAINTICGLVRIIATSLFSKSTQTTTAMKPSMTLVLDQNQRIWSVLASILDRSPSQNHQLLYLIEHFFLGIRDLMLLLAQAEWQGSLRHRACSLWAECIAEFLYVTHKEPSTPTIDSTISIIQMVTDISSRIPELGPAVRESLHPVAKPVMEGKISESSSHARLQVRLFSCTGTD